MAQVSKTGFIDQFSGMRRGLGRLAREITVGLDALHRVQFEEPWKTERRTMRGGR